MRMISRFERAEVLDKLVRPGQQIARSLPPGRLRDSLHGVWLGHPLHPVLVQAPVGAWLSASLLDLMPGTGPVVRRLTAFGLVAAVPAAMAGAADWSQQHEQQMRVGVVHALANSVAIASYGSSLACRSSRLGRLLRLGGLAAVAAGGVLGGHLSFRLAGGANHAEAVPHLVQPGWHHLMTEDDLTEGKPVRQMLGEVPVVAIRRGGQVHVLADRCSHMSGPLAEGELAEGQLTCPWHGSIFSICDGSVTRGPATAPQPVFETRSVGGAIQVLLPGAG